MLLAGIKWVEGRDATKYLQCIKLLLTTKNYPAEDVNSVRETSLQKGNKLENLEQVKGQLTSEIILLVEAI